MIAVKQMLLRQLSDAGWELIDRDHDTEWWTDEIWTIRSIRQNYGLELFISFLVDPQYEGNEKETAIWCLSVNWTVPRDRPMSNDEEIAGVGVQKGHQAECVREFIAALDDIRNSPEFTGDS